MRTQVQADADMFHLRRREQNYLFFDSNIVAEVKWKGEMRGGTVQINWHDTKPVLAYDVILSPASSPRGLVFQVINSLPLSCLKHPTLFVDVLSVKEYPRDMLELCG